MFRNKLIKVQELYTEKSYTITKKKNKGLNKRQDRPCT